MVFAGTAMVAAAVLAGAQVGLLAVAWALGVSLAIYLTAAVRGAPEPGGQSGRRHIPAPGFPPALPASLLDFAVAGAVLAGLTVLVLYGSFIRRFEEEQGVTRGKPGSQLSAMMLGEYFPNPGAAGTGEAALALVCRRWERWRWRE